VTGIRALLFDLDGTLYVNNGLGVEIRLAACRYIGELKGVGTEEANSLIDETKKSLSAASGRDTSLGVACIELGGDLRELHRRFAREVDPVPFLSRDAKVIELLRELNSRLDLHIYTNNNQILSKKIMDKIGVGGYFREVFTIETFWRPKPDRECLTEIFSRIGMMPEECLFIGDRYDIDLRLPAEMGSSVLFVKNTEDLLHLAVILGRNY
jgi:putative hydrolase of the HAD superfamily